MINLSLSFTTTRKNLMTYTTKIQEFVGHSTFEDKSARKKTIAQQVSRTVRIFTPITDSIVKQTVQCFSVPRQFASVVENKEENKHLGIKCILKE